MTQEPKETKETMAEVFERMEDEIKNVLPGIKVDCHISLDGYTKIEKSNISTRDEGTTKVTSYDAKHIVEFPEEKKEAAKVGSNIRREVEKHCVNTAIGLICPISRKKELFKTLLWGMKKETNYNDESKHWKIHFSHAKYNIEGSNKGAIAEINNLIADMMSEIQSAIQESDKKILKKTRPVHLPKGKSIAQIMNLPEEEKRPIISKARAELTRQALAHTKGIELFLPEEAGQAVTNLVKDLRKQARAVVKAGKKDQTSYEQALQSVDLAGVSSLQAAMVRASHNAKQQEQESLEKEIEEMETPDEIEETPIQLPANVVSLFGDQSVEDDEEKPLFDLPKINQ